MTRRRAEFSAETKRQAFRRSGGICECHRIPHVFMVACGRLLGPGNVWYEHINPDALCSRNDLDNCAVLTKTCGRYKSAAYDTPVIAKVKRVADRDRGIRPTPRQRLPGGRGDPFKITINRGVVDRRTGAPWRLGR